MSDSSKGRRPRRQFDEEFRAQAVRLVLDDGKTVGAVARGREQKRRPERRRRREVQRPVRPVTVVVVNEDVEYALEMASVQDQEPVEALRTNGPHEALGDSVRLRSAKRRADDWDPVASEDRVKLPVNFLSRSRITNRTDS
jgi:transposase-like protein